MRPADDENDTRQIVVDRPDRPAAYIDKQFQPRCRQQCHLIARIRRLLLGEYVQQQLGRQRRGIVLIGLQQQRNALHAGLGRQRLL